MRKVRSEALWNQLSEEQRETLDGWLFDENLSYAQILPRAQQELGFPGKVSSLKRYYQHRSQERAVADLAERVADAAELKGTAEDAETLRQATMKLLAAQAFQQVRETPEEASKWGPAVKMMLQHGRNETVREGQRIRQALRVEDQEIRREAIEFGREKFQLDMIARAVEALPELQKLAAAMDDPDLNRYIENPHWREARLKMFPHGIGGREGEDPSTKHQGAEDEMAKGCVGVSARDDQGTMPNDQASQGPMKSEAQSNLTNEAKEVSCPSSVVRCDGPKSDDEQERLAGTLAPPANGNIEPPTPNAEANDQLYAERGIENNEDGANQSRLTSAATSGDSPANAQKERLQAEAQAAAEERKVRESWAASGAFRIVGRDKTG